MWKSPKPLSHIPTAAATGSKLKGEREIFCPGLLDPFKLICRRTAQNYAVSLVEFMKKTIICFALFVLLASVSNAQTKSVTGKVVNLDTGASGRFSIITIKVGSKEYSAYTFSANGEKSHNPTTVGDVNTVGKTVRVYYTKIVGNELRATKIVEIKKSKK